MSSELHKMIAALTARVEALEAFKAAQSADQSAANTKPATPVDGLNPEKYWVLHGLAKSTHKGGEVLYAGQVQVPTGEQYLWQRHGGANDLFKQDWATLDVVIAALGHPVRLRLLKCILEGKQTKAELEKLDGIGTTGQLYHHLKSLEEGGWVRSLQRGTYGVPAERVVPLLSILLAAQG
jgi:DNA-binding transcriptional ArsR family regulator